MKPIEFEELKQAIQRAKEDRASTITQEQLKVMWDAFQRLEQQQQPTNIAIHTQEGIFYRNMGDIVRLQAERSYTFIHFLAPQKPLLASSNIGQFEEQFLNHPHFMKVHRSSIINLHQVDRYVKSDGGYLVMKDGESVSVSRAYRTTLLNRLGNL